MKDNKLIKKIESTIISILKKEGGASGLKPIKKAVDNLDKPEKFNLVKHLSKMSNVKKHKNSDYILTPINENKKSEVEVLKELKVKADFGFFDSIHTLDHLMKEIKTKEVFFQVINKLKIV